VHAYYPADQVEEYEMGRTYSTYGGVSNTYKILVRKPEGRDQSKDLGRNKNTVLRFVLKS
jgi:hypothetical protein